MSKNKLAAARSIKDQKTLRATVKGLEDAGRKVQVVGQVVNGKIQLDPASLSELQRKLPNAEMAFVAVNAPFDPVTKTS